MASEAADQLGLDRVLFIPVSSPPHKEVAHDPGPEVRLQLCELATEGDERFEVSRIELDRGGESYTVETLRALTAAHPDDELFFIAGADIAGIFWTGWREPEEILRLATLAVGEREGVLRRDISEQMRGADVTFFDMPRIDVSSSDLRRRLRAGRCVRYLLSDRVIQHISSERLYSE